MKREYPYLLDSYLPTIDPENKEKRNFLSLLDNMVNQKQYVRITLLDWQENPLREIQGDLTSGSINKDGASPIRTTCSLSAAVNSGDYNVDTMSMDFAPNKKVFVEIGLKNTTPQFREYDILWFPQGVFFINEFNMSSSTSSSVNISLSLKDKMCMLNGDIGGTFPSTIILDVMDTQNSSGAFESKKVLIVDIIKELVNHWGGEELNNIVITDVPTRIKRILKWTGSSPIYLSPIGSTAQSNNFSYKVTEEIPSGVTLIDAGESVNNDIVLNNSAGNIAIQINNGTDAGYVFEDFVYGEELTMQAGQNVTDALEAIKNYLGNFEYFYDEFGVFHFREIRNYLNTTQGKIVLDEMQKKHYLVEVTSDKTEYSFSDNNNISSITVNPQYGNIKNDYIVQGKKALSNTNILPTIMYHVAIDNKPTPGSQFSRLLLYKEKDTDIVKPVFPIELDTNDKLPAIGDFNLVYKVREPIIETLDYSFEKGEIKTLQQQILTLQWQNIDLKKEIDKKQQLIKSLTPEFDVLSAKVNTIDKQMNDISKNISKYETKIADLDAEIEHYKAGIREINKQQAALLEPGLSNAIETPLEKKEDVDKFLKQFSSMIDEDGLFKEYPNIYMEKLQNCQRLINDFNNESDTEKLLSLTQEIEAAQLELRTWVSTWKYLYDSLLQDPDLYNVLAKIIDSIVLDLNNAELEKSTKEKEKEELERQFKELEEINRKYDARKTEITDLKTNVEKDSRTYDDRAKDITDKQADLKAKEESLEKQPKTRDTGKIGDSFYYWEDNAYKLVDVVAYYDTNNPYKTQDWRTELYLQGLVQKNMGLTAAISLGTSVGKDYAEYSNNNLHALKTSDPVGAQKHIAAIAQKIYYQKVDVDYYFPELDAYWPQIYDLKEQKFYGQHDNPNVYITSLTNGNYFLDFIDPLTSSLGEFSVSNIGRRQQVTVDENINCLFQPEIPNIVYLKSGAPNLAEQKEECIRAGQPYTQVPEHIYNAFWTGGHANAAFDQIKFDMFTHTNYQKTLSLTTLPIFYLQPNTRVKISDKTTLTYGDYMVQSISLPLGPGGTMSVTCSQCTERN